MHPSALFAVHSSVIATAQAGCCSGGETRAPDQVQANNILSDVYNGTSRGFRGGETRYQCRNAGTANKKLEFWVICASISLLSARHLLVERNMHYPLQLYFNQLIATAILAWRPRLAWRCVRSPCLGRPQLSRLMTRGTTLLVASVCCTSLSTICMLQATLHFYNLPVLAMITVRQFCIS